MLPVLFLYQFGLICDASSGKSRAQSMYFAAMLVASLVSGWCSDRYGRYKTMVSFLGITFVGAVWTAAAGSFGTFVLARFVTGKDVCGKGL